jgi:cold shock CspA family protein
MKAMKEGIICGLGERNSGFIKEPGKTEELFFDASDLIGITFKELKIGDRLLFAITQSLKGPYATQETRP